MIYKLIPVANDSQSGDHAKQTGHYAAKPCSNIKCLLINLKEKYAKLGYSKHNLGTNKHIVHEISVLFAKLSMTVGLK